MCTYTNHVYIYIYIYVYNSVYIYIYTHTYYIFIFIYMYTSYARSIHMVRIVHLLQVTKCWARMDDQRSVEQDVCVLCIPWLGGRYIQCFFCTGIGVIWWDLNRIYWDLRGFKVGSSRYFHDNLTCLNVREWSINYKPNRAWTNLSLLYLQLAL